MTDTPTRQVSPRAAAALVALLAIGVVAINLDLPILRNSLVYARVSVLLLDANLDLDRVVHDYEQTFGKPVGFPLIATPLVAAFGINHGMKLASAVGGLAFLWACTALFRQLLPALGIDRRRTWLCLALTFLNPLVLYQFWSAYPDIQFAAACLWGLVWVDRAVRDPQAPWWTVPAAVGAIYLAVITRYYGAVLLGIFPLYAAIQGRTALANLVLQRRHQIAGTIAILGFAGALGAAVAQRNPTLHLDQDIGGAASYLETLAGVVGIGIEISEVDDAEQDDAPVVAVDDDSSYREINQRLRRNLPVNLAQLATYLVMTANLAVLLAVRRRNLSRPALGLILVIALYVGALLPYPHAWFNQRFYVPMAPLLALLIVNGLDPRYIRGRDRAVLGAALGLGALLAWNYNTTLGHRLLWPLNTALQPRVQRPTGFPWMNIDCLRMHRHLIGRWEIDNINRTLPAGATLFLVDNYYHGVALSLYPRSGLLRDDIAIETYQREYLVPWDEPPCTEPPYPCYQYRLSKSRPAMSDPDPAGRSEPWLQDRHWGLWQIVPPGAPRAHAPATTSTAP